MAATLKEVSPSERNDDIPLLPEAIQVWKEVAEHLKSETQGECVVVLPFYTPNRCISVVNTLFTE